MFKILYLLLLLVVVNCLSIASAQMIDISILNKIFTSTPRTETENPFAVKTSGNEDQPCDMEDGSIGQCVKSYLCDETNTIIDDGGIGPDTFIIDPRLGSRNAGTCIDNFDICCLPRQNRPTTKDITPSPVRAGCGWRNPNGISDRIMNTDGDAGETTFGEFPWMVFIFKNLEGPELFVGGGSLIAPSVVLTAAHRVLSSDSLKIRAGEWDIQNTLESYHHQDRVVASKEIHKNFIKRGLHYDVALLFLSTPVDLAPNVGLACLPPPGIRTPADTQCIATGWGKDKFDKKGQFQLILKKVVVPVVDHNACQSAFRKTRLGRFFNLHHTFMCAGGEKGKDTCRGDGGAPLSCPIPFQQDRYVQTGIVAWGIGCGEEGIPGAYVDVSSVRQWIDDIIISKGLDTSVYSF